jgi:RNA polymerase sigma-70 factor (ECF subfamily)
MTIANSSGDESARRSSAQFATTHWSVVLAAGDSASPGSREALEKLCRTYWFPLYAFARRTGRLPEDAEDLVQGFFAYLLEKHLVSKARQEAGRVRSFLFASFKHYLSQENKRDHAQKRGGGQVIVSLDAQMAEEWLGAEVSTELSPDVLYERHWATAVIREALELLKQEYETEGKSDLFEALSPYLQGERGQPSHAALGQRLGISESAARSSVFRLRRRSRELLRAVVAHTVADPWEVDEELRHLMTILGR